MFLVLYGYLSYVGNYTVASDLSLEVVVLPVLDIFITNRTVIKQGMISVEFEEECDHIF